MHPHVTVVGAGPVGLMLAGELRLGGARVTVLERLSTPTTESRASTLHARTMEIFDQRGLLAYLGTPPNERSGHFGGIPLDLGSLDTQYPGQWKVPQAQVESLLAQWAGGLGAEILRDHEVCDLSDEGDHVRVVVDTPAGRQELICDYLVGCDGERGTVRSHAGIAFTGTEATRELLRADVLGVEVPNRRFERLSGGLAISATRNGVTRVMVSTFEPPAGPRGVPPTFDDVCQVWKLVTGDDISTGTPTWVSAFDNASKLAARYRSGRVMLAGDAAHNQMPAGGQAINLGLQDAVNLGWKLAAVATGRAPQRLLETYHTERHEVGRRVLANIEAQSMLLLGDSTVDAVRAVLGELVEFPRVTAALAGMISGLDVSYGDGDHPLISARMPHVELTTPLSNNAVSTTSTTALLRAGRGVLLDLSDDPAHQANTREAATGWAGRVDLVTATVAPDAPFSGRSAVLIRPDGYVAWMGGPHTDPRPAMHTWFGPAR